MPESIGNLIHLEHFRVDYNKFSNTLDFLSGLTLLTYTNLATNDFYGPFPSFLTELCAKEITNCQFDTNIGFVATASESWATPVPRVPRKPTALPMASATTASNPQTISIPYAQAVPLTLGTAA
ncbi:hypothetical protein TrLO_g2460 [Triparma laevis f. longispina]|uniref:Uncharacterized protein n=1 Tax=Triparma laevis f. longispina TaxID=1714387 RepID=A0A9W7FK81_9STRA|nr:hypothetical protein TrLO_g2460 [Triparma laevis f. longispina]